MKAQQYAMKLLESIMVKGITSYSEAISLLKAHHTCHPITLSQAGLIKILKYEDKIYTLEAWTHHQELAAKREKRKELRKQIIEMEKQLATLHKQLAEV